MTTTTTQENLDSVTLDMAECRGHEFDGYVVDSHGAMPICFHASVGGALRTGRMVSATNDKARYLSDPAPALVDPTTPQDVEDSAEIVRDACVDACGMIASAGGLADAFVTVDVRGETGLPLRFRRNVWFPRDRRSGEHRRVEFTLESFDGYRAVFSVETVD